MERIEPEPLRLDCPLFADELDGREALEGFEAAAEIVGCDEVGEVAPELFVAVVVEASDGGFLDGAVHPFDLPVIRYVICGAFSSCCSSFGTALW
jgi:hypothetical protein